MTRPKSTGPGSNGAESTGPKSIGAGSSWTGPLWAATATAASPVLRGLLRLRAARGKEIAARLPERRGIDQTTRPDGRLIWLHAASVGETMSILPVLSALARQARDASILLTTGTVTSAALLDQRLPALNLPSVIHRFAPLDVPHWVARFLDHWRPDLAGFVESELWPNILRACQTRAIPAMLINARMSARSFAAWSRAPATARFVLSHFALIRARGTEDAGRLRALGATTVAVAGDLKRAAPALPADPDMLRDLGARLAGRPVWLAASTHPGEEPLIRAVHDAILPRHPGLLTIVVPRHPERGAALSAQLRAPRRLAGDGPPAEGLWIADTLGEMGLWYRLAPIAVIGRSLVAPGGGQNPLEPARLGCAIAIGPHYANFTEHVTGLRDAGALTIVPGIPALTAFVSWALGDPEARMAMGRRAEAAVRSADSLPDETARAILGLMSGT